MKNNVLILSFLKIFLFLQASCTTTSGPEKPVPEWLKVSAEKQKQGFCHEWPTVEWAVQTQELQIIKTPPYGLFAKTQSRSNKIRYIFANWEEDGVEKGDILEKQPDEATRYIQTHAKKVQELDDFTINSRKLKVEIAGDSIIGRSQLNYLSADGEKVSSLNLADLHVSLGSVSEESKGRRILVFTVWAHEESVPRFFRLEETRMVDLGFGNSFPKPAHIMDSYWIPQSGRLLFTAKTTSEDMKNTVYYCEYNLVSK